MGATATTLRPTVIALVAVSAVTLTAMSPFPQTQPAVPRQKGGYRPTGFPPPARAVMEGFHNALQNSAWDRALSLCSPAVREKARQYDSALDFFEDVVPIEYLKTPDRPSQIRESQYYGAFATVIRFRSHTAVGQVLEWRWGVERTTKSADGTNGGKGDGWTIAFDTIPLRKWIAQEVLQQQARLDDHRARFKAIKPSLEKLKTRLVPLNDKFLIGKPMLFRLELINDGPVDLSYDRQQVDVNDPLIVTGENGKRVRYIGEECQTAGAFQPIRAGRTVVLFDKLDIARQYQINKPGRYDVQFSGGGLFIGDLPKDPGPGSERWHSIPEGAMPKVGACRAYPSNVVRIDVIR
jgi:hypothetical protein